ncbi:MAG: TPM domain-containing protein [Oscillospiraceae bacterium]|nr:TPM domain-containing protein [Oscillospiraceae bacterium]
MKRIILVVLVLSLIISLPCTVSAVNTKVIDEPGLLSSSEVRKLSEIAQTLADNYEIDAAIVIVNSLNGKTAQAYADDYFDYNDYGVGSNDSGVLLLVAMKEREWYVSTHAEGTAAVTNNEIDILDEDMVDYLSSGDYYDAFAIYLNFLELEFEHYRTYESGFTLKGLGTRLLTGLFIGSVIAVIALLIMRSKMNTAKQQSGAGSYMVNGSYDLYRCQDIFLYSKTTKTPKPQNNSSSSTHRSSSGRSHGGRGGRF